MPPPPPPIRACLFDMDGLLLDSEDKYTECVNVILHEHNRPSLPWSIKAQLQGRPGPEAGKIFHDWAQLPIPKEEYLARQAELQKGVFKSCKPLPGVEDLLGTLKGRARTRGRKGEEGAVRIALATSSHSGNYEVKTSHLGELFGLFEGENIVKGDDPRIPAGKGKPAPDIYLLALETVNEGIRRRRKGGQVGGGDAEDEREIRPEECLVFEDSVPGVEAGRRAGMQVVWCPHPGLLKEYRGKEKEVLAGKSGMVHSGREAGIGGTTGEIDDGWGRLMETLEGFDYASYGIEVTPRDKAGRL